MANSFVDMDINTMYPEMINFVTAPVEHVDITFKVLKNRSGGIPREDKSFEWKPSLPVNHFDEELFTL